MICFGFLFNNVDKMDNDMYEMSNLEYFYDLTSDSSFGKLYEQRIWGKYMFGIDQVKQPEELKMLLLPVIRKYQR